MPLGGNGSILRLTNLGHETVTATRHGNYVAVIASAFAKRLAQELIARDGANVESIEWDQKKSFSYLYQ